MPRIILDPITHKFTQINDPEKLPKIELTTADKAKVVKEFIEIFGRKPTKDEEEELYSEELKIKSGSNRG